MMITAPTEVVFISIQKHMTERTLAERTSLPQHQSAVTDCRNDFSESCWKRSRQTHLMKDIKISMAKTQLRRSQSPSADISRRSFGWWCNGFSTLENRTKQRSGETRGKKTVNIYNTLRPNTFSDDQIRITGIKHGRISAKNVISK